MADTQRTKASLLSLSADNVTGQISPQDLRDFMVTVMDEEFVNPGDFWAKPQAKYTTTDKTARGYIQYSQYMESAVSWMNILVRDASTGYWMRADVADSGLNGGQLGLAMDSYTAGYSTAEVLIKGLVYDSTFSTVFSRKIGMPVYLDSGVPGSISIGPTDNSVKIIGYVAASDYVTASDGGGSAIGKWVFNPIDWAVKGS